MKIQKAGFRLILLFLTASLPSLNTWAAGAGGGLGGFYLGPEVGYGVLSAGEGTHLDWGISAGTRLYAPFTLGVFYSYIPLGSNSSVGGVSVSGSEKFWGVQADYGFGSTLTGLTLGARLGMSSFSTQTVVPGIAEDDETKTGLAWGPVITYERPLSSSWSGGGMMYIMLPSEAGANNVFGILATLKFWFF